MRQRIGIWIWGPVLALLVGCAGGRGEQSLQQETFGLLQKELKARLTRKTAPPPPPTRAQLEAVQRPVMEVTIERAGVTGYVLDRGTRRDSNPGKITHWRTEDNISLFTRNGVLIATRGLGGDILSSQVPVRGSTLGPAFGGEHVQMIRDLDDREVPMAFGCDLLDLGVETIEAVERRYVTRHVQERCEARTGAVVNDYWIDSSAGLIRQSRQWAGPNIGYLKFRRLVD